MPSSDFLRYLPNQHVQEFRLKTTSIWAAWPLILGLVAAIVLYRELSWGPAESTEELALIGTWMGALGNSLEFRPDGSAVGKAYSSVGIYRWKVENGVLSMEPCPLNPGPKWLVRKCIDDAMNAKRRDDRELTQSGNSLILKDLNSSRELHFIRSRGADDGDGH